MVIWAIVKCSVDKQTFFVDRNSFEIGYLKEPSGIF